jgi:hypothetical protein
MRFTGNFQFDERVLFAVLPHDSFFTFSAGAGEKCKIRRYILEDDKAILRVDAFLHGAKVQNLFTSGLQHPKDGIEQNLQVQQEAPIG